MTEDEFKRAAQVKASFRARGESASDWAKAHGFDVQIVYRILNGRTPAYRGQTHQVAVALGLKPDPAKSRI
jgi:gp16 family phage-associated protein